MPKKVQPVADVPFPYSLSLAMSGHQDLLETYPHALLGGHSPAEGALGAGYLGAFPSPGMRGQLAAGLRCTSAGAGNRRPTALQDSFATAPCIRALGSFLCSAHPGKAPQYWPRQHTGAVLYPSACPQPGLSPIFRDIWE